MAQCGLLSPVRVLKDGFEVHSGKLELVSYAEGGTKPHCCTVPQSSAQVLLSIAFSLGHSIICLDCI